MTAALRPVRPKGHPATCECDPCGSYWAAALRFEIQVWRREHERMWEEMGRLGEVRVEAERPERVGAAFDVIDPEVMAAWLHHFREAWAREEQVGFDVRDAALVWVVKQRAFDGSVRRTQETMQKRAAAKLAPQEPGPEERAATRKRLARRVKQLRALQRSPVAAEAALAKQRADEIEAEMGSRPARIVKLYRRIGDLSEFDQYYPRGSTVEIGERMPEMARAVGARKAVLLDMDPDTFALGREVLTWVETSAEHPRAPAAPAAAEAP